MNHQPGTDLMVCREWLSKLSEDGPVPHIERLVHCPIGAGYFFRFCKSQYCSETTHFIIEVDKYIEIYCTDDGGWDHNKSWKDIDQELGISHSTVDVNIQRDMTAQLNNNEFIPAATWPSGKVDRLAVLESLRSIWTRFFADTAAEEICLPPNIIANTCKRLKNVHLYGKDVFHEACRDRTILSTQKDIATRFRQSEEFQIYLHRLQELQRPVCTVSIHIPAPRFTLTCVYTKNQLLEEDALQFSLDEMLSDSFLYGEFMKYLNRSFASENLRFIRAVYLFKKSFNAKDGDKDRMKKASDWAFKVFQNFILSGSVYEICVPKLVQREIARNVATPHLQMFRAAEKTTMTTLKLLFDAYRKTPEYIALRVKFAENFELLNQTASTGSTLSFNTFNSKLLLAKAMLQRQSSGGSNNGSGRGGGPGGVGSSSSKDSRDGRSPVPGTPVNDASATITITAGHSNLHPHPHVPPPAAQLDVTSTGIASLDSASTSNAAPCPSSVNSGGYQHKAAAASVGSFLPPINTSNTSSSSSKYKSDSSPVHKKDAVTPPSLWTAAAATTANGTTAGGGLHDCADDSPTFRQEPPATDPTRARSASQQRLLGASAMYGTSASTGTTAASAGGGAVAAEPTTLFQQDGSDPAALMSNNDHSSSEAGAGNNNNNNNGKERHSSGGSALLGLPILYWFGNHNKS